MEWFTPSLPAYAQIAQTLRTQIENKELGPDDKLPAERSLMEQFKVSRMTIRHALKILRSEGLIYDVFSLLPHWRLVSFVGDSPRL